MVLPCWCLHSFQLPLLRFMGLSLLNSFICFSPASAISSLLLFTLPSSVNLLSATLPFPFPFHSASLSFFHGGFLVRVADFDP